MKPETTEVSYNLQTIVDRFRNAFNEGLARIQDAANEYCRLLDEHPEDAETFRHQIGDVVTHSLWKKLELLGRGALHPRMLYGGVGPGKHNIIKKLPIDVQNRVFQREKFPLMLPSGDHLLVDMFDATPTQAEQLIGEDGSFRTPAGQKAWLASYENKINAEARPYTILNDCIVFRRGVRFTREELKLIIKEM